MFLDFVRLNQLYGEGVPPKADQTPRCWECETVMVCEPCKPNILGCPKCCPESKKFLD